LHCRWRLYVFLWRDRDEVRVLYEGSELVVGGVLELEEWC
jgi:hypothetical protein